MMKLEVECFKIENGGQHFGKKNLNKIAYEIFGFIQFSLSTKNFAFGRSVLKENCSRGFSF